MLLGVDLQFLVQQHLGRRRDEEATSQRLEFLMWTIVISVPIEPEVDLLHTRVHLKQRIRWYSKDHRPFIGVHVVAIRPWEVDSRGVWQVLLQVGMVNRLGKREPPLSGPIRDLPKQSNDMWVQLAPLEKRARAVS